MQYRTASRITRSLRRVKPIEIEEDLSTEPWLQSTLDWYEDALETKTREDARKYLPLDILADFHWYIDIRNLMHFLEERLASDAQDEIKCLAVEIEKLFADNFPLTHKNWRENFGIK